MSRSRCLVLACILGLILGAVVVAGTLQITLATLTDNVASDLLVFGAGFWVSPGPGGAGCTQTLGYWRNHGEAWPVDSLALGAEEYGQAMLLALLNTPSGGDASLILSRQLIAAKLNAAQGADPADIDATLAAADAWLAGCEGLLPYGVPCNLPEGQVAVGLAVTLDEYNNGVTGPGHCEEEVAAPAPAIGADSAALETESLDGPPVCILPCTPTAYVAVEPTAELTATVAPTLTPTPAATVAPTVGPTTSLTSTQAPTVEPTATPMPTLAPTLTPTVAATPTLTGTVEPPACLEAILNGSFEGPGIWTRGPIGRPAAYSQAQVYDGEWAVRLGVEPDGVDVASASWVEQAVSLRADAVRAELAFWAYPLSADPEGDGFVLRVRDQAGAWHTLLEGWGAHSAWNESLVDLQGFAGQSLALRFTVVNNGLDGSTAVYLDDVSLEVCGP